MLITAEQRRGQYSGASILILGQSNIGKTSLCRQLDPLSTLFVDIESGAKVLADWDGMSITGVRTWEYIRDIGCMIGGPDPNAIPSKNQPKPSYCQAHYDFCVQQYPAEFAAIEESKTIFIDSITEMSRLAMAYAERSPKAVTKQGGFDRWAAFDIMAQEMLGFLRHTQARADKNKIYVGILEKHLDEFKRGSWQPQLEGAKTSKTLPGIMDNIFCMVKVKLDQQTGGVSLYESGNDMDVHRVFICHNINPFGLPAKERTNGAVQMIEQCDLRAVLEKINGAERNPQQPDFNPTAPEHMPAASIQEQANA